MAGDIIVADIHRGWDSNNTLFQYSVLITSDSGVWRASAVKTVITVISMIYPSNSTILFYQMIKMSIKHFHASLLRSCDWNSTSSFFISIQHGIVKCFLKASVRAYYSEAHLTVLPLFLLPLFLKEKVTPKTMYFFASPIKSSHWVELPPSF